MVSNNLKIILGNGSQLDYTSPESLGIKFNRITDDFQQPEKKFFDFSYTVQFPKTKNNALLFEFPDTHGRNYIFNGKSFDVQVFNNNQLLLKGIITLLSFDKDSYNCQITSNIKELTDSLKGKNLNDMTALDTIEWDYEKTIVEHINSNYNYTQTSYQFPLSMYKTFFCSGNTSGNTEANFTMIYNYDTMGGRPHPFNGRNYLYQLHFPPAVYVYNIIKGLFADIGWQLTGNFIETTDFRKIIIPYCGKVEGYANAIVTSASDTLNLNKILPEIDQTEFLKSIINTFNLYMLIDASTKTVTLETYNTLFNNYSESYDITDNIDKESIKVSFPNADVKISFDKKGNTQVSGYDRIPDYFNMFYSYLRNQDQNPTNCINVNNVLRRELIGGYNLTVLTNGYNPNAFNNLYNKTSGDKEIKLKFSAANYVSMTLRNTMDKTLTYVWATGDPLYFQNWKPLFTVSIPLLSDQTIGDNKDHPFADDLTTTYTEGNDPTAIDYTAAGDIKLYYYYGNFTYDTVTTGTTYSPKHYNDWVYLHVATGGTSIAPTYCTCNVPIASPFKLMSTPEFDNLKTKIKNTFLDTTIHHYQTELASTEIGAEAQGLLQTYYSVGTEGNTHTPTNYSLTLGDNPDFSEPNLYTYFHQNKYELYKNSSLLTADMRCSEIDWSNLQIYTPILYNKELYQLVSLKNYDPIKRTAEVSMIKKI